MTKKSEIWILLLSVLLIILPQGKVSAQRHLLEEAFDAIPNKMEVFKVGGDWFPYPAYTDRKAWARLGEGYREQAIKDGEKYIEYVWQSQTATSYIEYEKTGNRALMKPQEENHKALIVLTIAELLEGEGRFLPQLTNGLWFLSQQPSWSHAQHTQYQLSHRTLPNVDDNFISLHSANTGASVAIAWHFFHKELDNIDPSISKTVRAAIKKQILTPYLDESKDENEHKIWSGFKKDEGRRLNNWTPYCVANSLIPFLLMEQDQEALLRAIKRSVQSVDMYLNDAMQDGACDEGPSYWAMSCGKVYDFCRLLCDASGGKIDVFSDKLIKNMGEFKSKTYFGDGWVMNFGDGTARDKGDISLMFRFGTDTNSRELTDFVVLLLANPSQKQFNTPGINYDQTYRTLEMLRYGERLRKAENKAINSTDGDWRKMIYYLRADVKSVYYPDAQYAVLRNTDSWVLATKGGNNAESHNHNDVGSFILMVDDIPILLDPGVGIYTKDTFSPNRYTIWSNRSDWHNLPVINGVVQEAGRDFCAIDTDCDIRKRFFQTDLAKAYPATAQCSSWQRTLSLDKERFAIVDNFVLSSRVAADTENLIVRGRVYLPETTTPDGYLVPRGEVVCVGQSFSQRRELTVKIEYPVCLTPSVDKMDISQDPKMKRVWGDELMRIRFTSATNAPAIGSYTFGVTKMSEVVIIK